MSRDPQQHGGQQPDEDLPADAERDRFEELTLPHLDRLYRYALRLSRQAAEAEDLVQETYLHAWRAFERTDLSGDCRPWLFRILTNLFISRYRRKKREPALMDFQENPAFADGRSTDETITAGDTEPLLDRLDDRVKAALDALHPEFRAVLLLAAVEGLSYEEIARVCEIPIGTVMSRLHRGRTQLKDRLRGYAQEMGYTKGV